MVRVSSILTVTSMNRKFEFTFEGIRFIPSYRDVDYDCFVVDAENAKEAWLKLDQFTKRWTWRVVSLTKIKVLK
jgi:hypothetical protein